jgi:hypothetical protein
MNIIYLVSKYPFLWGLAYSATEVYLKVMYNTYWAIFAHFTGILLELVRHYEIRPQSKPKVFFKGLFESCSLEINQLLVNWVAKIEIKLFLENV